MASDYLRRVEALEAAIEPAKQIAVAICQEGVDEDAACERACAAKGLRRDDPGVKVICVRFPKSPLPATDAG